MGRPRKKRFEAGQLVEPTEAYTGEINGMLYTGYPGKTRLDGGHPAVQAWPHLHKLIDPKAYEKDE